MCARIKYTALVDNIRGSIQGTTFQRNAYGYTIKGKPNMVNPNTHSQRSRKTQFSKATQEWKNLTDGERAAWDTYAATFPVPTRSNPDSYLNGFNAFVRWTGVAQLAGGATTLTDPTGDQGTVLSDFGEIRNTAGVLSFLLDAVTTEGPWRVCLFISRPLSPTQRYVKSWTRFIRSGTEAAMADIDITSQYTAVYGAVPAAGDLVGMRLTFINTTNGQVFFIPAIVGTVTAG